MQTISRMYDQPVLTEQLPVLIRHEGIWDGVYQYFDARGKQTDEHQSRLICRFPVTGTVPYHQTNYYLWMDGREEVREFPARLRDGRLCWDGGLIDGWAADVDLDEFGRTSMLYWVRKDRPAEYLYEMIHLSDCGQHRARVWQQFRDGQLLGRTLINEHKYSDDWSNYPV
jgi:hypothetical protein